MGADLGVDLGADLDTEPDAVADVPEEDSGEPVEIDPGGVEDGCSCQSVAAPAWPRGALGAALALGLALAWRRRRG
jgi:MYXO-CTERM domain-containing protein